MRKRTRNCYVKQSREENIPGEIKWSYYQGCSRL